MVTSIKIDRTTDSINNTNTAIHNNNNTSLRTISIMNENNTIMNNNNQTYKNSNNNIVSSSSPTSYYHFQQQQPQEEQQQQYNNQQQKNYYYDKYQSNDYDENCYNYDSTTRSRRSTSRKQNDNDIPNVQTTTSTYNDVRTHQQHFLRQQQQQQRIMNYPYHINTNTHTTTTISAAAAAASPPESDVFNDITNNNSTTTTTIQSYAGSKRIGTPFNNNNNRTTNSTTGTDSIIKRRIQTPKSTIRFNYTTSNTSIRNNNRTSPFQYHPTLNDQQQPLRLQEQQLTSNGYNHHTILSSASSCSSSSSSSSSTENTTDAILSPMSMTFFQSLQNQQQQSTNASSSKKKSDITTKQRNETKTTTTSTSTTRRRLKLWSILFGSNKTNKKVNDFTSTSSGAIIETNKFDSHYRIEEAVDKVNKNNMIHANNQQNHQYQHQQQQQQVVSKRKRQRTNQINSSSYLWTGANLSPIASFDNEEEEILFSPEINFTSNQYYNLVDTDNYTKNNIHMTNTARQNTATTTTRLDNYNNNKQNTVIVSETTNNNNLSFTSAMKKLFFPRFYYTNQRKRLEQQQSSSSNSESLISLPLHSYQYRFIDTNDISSTNHVPNERTSLLIRNKQQLYSNRLNNGYNNNNNNQYNDLHIRTCTSDVSNPMNILYNSNNNNNDQQNNHHLHRNPTNSTEQMNNFYNDNDNNNLSKILSIETLNEQYLRRKVLYLTWGNFVCITSIFYLICMGFYDWISWIQINDSVNTITFGINSNNYNNQQQQQQLQQQPRYGITATNDDYFNTYHIDKAVSYMNDKTTNTIQKYLNRRNYNINNNSSSIEYTNTLQRYYFRNNASNLDWTNDNNSADDTTTLLYENSFNHVWLYPIGMPPDRTMSIFGSFSSTQTKYVIYESLERLKEHSISHKEENKQTAQYQTQQQNETGGIMYTIKLLYHYCCHQLYQPLSTIALCMYYVAYIAMKIIPSWFMCSSIIEWIVLVFIWNYIITYLLDNTQQQSQSQSHLSTMDANKVTNNNSHQKSHPKQQITNIVLLYITTIIIGQLWSIALDAFYSRLVTNVLIIDKNAIFNDDNTYSNDDLNNSNNSIALILLLYFTRETGCIAWGTIGLLSFFLATIGSTATTTTSQGLLMPWTKAHTETISNNNSANNKFDYKCRTIFLSFIVLILIVIMTQQFVRCHHYNGYYNSSNSYSYTSSNDNQSSSTTTTLLKPTLQSKYLILDQVLVVLLSCCLWGYTIGYIPYAYNQYNNSIQYEESKEKEMMVLPTTTVHTNSNDEEDDIENDSYERFTNKNDSFYKKEKVSTIMTILTVSSRYCFQLHSYCKRYRSNILIQRLYHLIIGPIGYCFIILSLLWILPVWYLCYAY